MEGLEGLGDIATSSGRTIGTAIPRKDLTKLHNQICTPQYINTYMDHACAHFHTHTSQSVDQMIPM